MMVTYCFFAVLLCIHNSVKIVMNTFWTSTGVKERIGVVHNQT